MAPSGQSIKRIAMKFTKLVFEANTARADFLAAHSRNWSRAPRIMRGGRLSNILLSTRSRAASFLLVAIALTLSATWPQHAAAATGTEYEVSWFNAVGIGFDNISACKAMIGQSGGAFGGYIIL